MRSNTRMDNAIEQLLRQHHVQVTAQRIAILRAVSALPHATADELADHVRGLLGAISRQAVYDTLAVLVDKKLLRRIQPAGSAARYEDRVGDSHHHLICRGCGKTFDIDLPAAAEGAAEAVLPTQQNHGFEIDEVEVTYWGRCPTCLRAAVAVKAPHSSSPAGAPALPAASKAGKPPGAKKTRNTKPKTKPAGGRPAASSARRSVSPPRSRKAR